MSKKNMFLGLWDFPRKLLARSLGKIKPLSPRKNPLKACAHLWLGGKEARKQKSEARFPLLLLLLLLSERNVSTAAGSGGGEKGP